MSHASKFGQLLAEFQFLKGHWTVGLGSFWLLTGGHLHLLVVQAYSCMATCFIKARKGQSASKTETTILSNLNMEVKSQPICHILLVRSIDGSCPYSRGGDYTGV